MFVRSGMAALHYTKLAGCIQLSESIGAILHGQPAIISMIMSGNRKRHIDIARTRVRNCENQSERTIVCLPETNARALISIQDENIKEKAISHIENVLNRKTPKKSRVCLFF